jgi:nucleoside-diphosphate-sugar epimerase
MWTILGSSGSIGRRLVSHLKANGGTPYTPGRLDSDLYKRPLGHVIYAIGLTADFRQRPYDTVEAHVSLLAKLLQLGDFNSLLYLSSTRVYARAPSGREDTPLPVLTQDASDLYNLSKLMGESLCLRDARAGVRVARLSNVVGGEGADSANFLPSLIRESQCGRIVLQTAPDSVKDYIHIDDVVELLLSIAESGRERLYNVASGVQTTNRQLTDLLSMHSGCSVEVDHGALKASFTPIDISRITSEFNFEPRPMLANLIGLL